jgi:hypothetical protein
MGMHWHIRGSAEQQVIDRMERSWRVELVHALLAMLRQRLVRMEGAMR